MPAHFSEVPFETKALLPLAAISQNFAYCHATVVPQFASRFGISEDQAEDLFSIAITKCLNKLGGHALSAISAPIDEQYYRQGVSLLWSVATRQRIDDVRSFNRRKTFNLEPREDGEINEDGFGFTEEHPDLRVLASELGQLIPAFMERAQTRKGDRQLLDALRRCAVEVIPDASEAEFVCFTHAYLYDECCDYQLPNREEISARLCEIMDKKRNALHVQVHRLKPAWEEARDGVAA